MKRYIDECLAGKDGPRGKDFNMRWVASMVADVFRVLSRGGIFMYPRDAKNKEGRLRLMYEANPMAFIVEQAGGAATDGRTPILDIAAEGAAPAHRGGPRLEERSRRGSLRTTDEDLPAARKQKGRGSARPFLDSPEPVTSGAC